MKNPLSNFQQRVKTRVPKAFRALSDLEEEMEDWFEQATKGWVSDYQDIDFTPSCNFKETSEDFILELEIPGIKKDEVNIEVDNHRLIVSGERERKKEDKDARYFLSESYYGSFMRAFSLPSAVDEERIHAHYENGLLTIKVPKIEKSKSKKISIN